MAHAEICPVCKGSGKLKNYPDLDQPSTTVPAPDVTCHGCGGCGWVTVGVDYPPVSPCPGWIPPWPPNPYPIYWDTGTYTWDGGSQSLIRTG